MRPVAVILLLVTFAFRASCEELREWTDRGGRKFTAAIVAADAWRATFVLADRSKAVLPLAQLSTADATFVNTWRTQNPGAPLVDPQRLAPWPADASATDIEVKVKSENPKDATFVFEGAHFIMQSDVRLPLGVVRDLNAVFEGTRAALMALPLGLFAGGEMEKYPVLLFSTPEQYGRAGGGTATGGYFQGATGNMLILLPNLGIRVNADAKTFDYQKNLFVVKHEVTHQILQKWGGAFPVWFHEGLAEVIAATPYVRGHYTFSAMDTAISTYVQKWRRPGDLKPLYLIQPARLMEFDDASWEGRLAGQSAYELYNSAALFVYFLLRHDGDGSSIAGFLDTMRRELFRSRAEAASSPFGRQRGAPISELSKKTVTDFIRRGRSDERLASDFAAFLKRRGLRVEFEVPLQQGR